MQSVIDKNNWALVTGASSGIGKAFAEQLARRGVNLFLTARGEKELAELAKFCTDRYGVQAVFLGADLADPASVEKIVCEVENQNLSIDILVNSAGFGYFGDFCSMAFEQIERMIRVDVTSCVQLCRLFLPKMKLRRRGVIINIASVAGSLPYPYAAVYAAAKGFQHLFTRALWAENQERNVKILSLCPGYTKTNFEKVSAEPSGIHLFPGEDPNEIAQWALCYLSGAGHTLFTRWTHPIKIVIARALPLKVFAWILKRLSQPSLSKNKPLPTPADAVDIEQR